mgnify:CR=1 FL=1
MVRTLACDPSEASGLHQLRGININQPIPGVGRPLPTQGNITLNQANVVNTFTASNTAGNVTFVDGVGALTLKTIDTSLANGTITVQSEPGKGSTFKLRFPKERIAD